MTSACSTAFWLGNRELVPTIRALRDTAERARRNEVERFAFDIARYRQIEHHHRAVFTRRKRTFDDAFTYDRQRTRGAAHHDIVQRKLRRYIIKRNHAPQKTVCQVLRAGVGAVGEGQAFRMMRGEMTGAQFDHFSRTDKQNRLLGDARINTPRQLHCCGCHRHCARANIGFAAHAFRYRKSTLEQLVEQQTHGAGAFGGTHCILELAEDLRLADHHGVQTAGNAKRVLDRAFLRQSVEERLDLLRLELVIRRHPFNCGARLFGVTIDFGAIARRNDSRFLHRPPRHQIVQRPHQTLSMKNHLLAHVQRSCLMVQAYGEKLHIAGYHKRAFILPYRPYRTNRKHRIYKAFLGSGQGVAW